MFRSKPPRHSNPTPPESSLLPPLPPPRTPLASSSASSADAMPSLAHSNNTSAHSTSHASRSRLRMPWRRAKSGFDVAPAPAPRQVESAPVSLATSSFGTPPASATTALPPIHSVAVGVVPPGDPSLTSSLPRQILLTESPPSAPASASACVASASFLSNAQPKSISTSAGLGASVSTMTMKPCAPPPAYTFDEYAPCEHISTESIVGKSSIAASGPIPRASSTFASNARPTLPSPAISTSASAAILPQVDSVTVPHTDSMPSDSISDESFATKGTHTASASNNHLRQSIVQRFSNMFKESDGRYEENLKSMKRRVIQVRRQPDSAPVRFKMGFRSRTGWEPIRATKENQDCLIALVPWGPGSRYNFFAALDGHGRNGHQCAMFIAQKVVAYLKRFLLALSSTQAIINTFYRAIIYAEKKLEMVEDIDFNLSGSTGVFVLIHGTTMLCANVGDSRAVIGRDVPNARARRNAALVDRLDGPKSKGKGNLSSRERRRYRAVPMSFDHKPARDDEKQRLLQSGARVDTWDSIDVGDERVWLPHARTPGLAVSRSFGDLVLKPYGVNAIPEIYALELSDADRFVVMASDGVFEFIQNQELIDVVGRWRDRGSAQDAAEELVRIATDRWIDDDSVIDDISCVVVFMNVLEPDVDAAQEPQIMEATPGLAEDGDGGADDCTDGVGATLSRTTSGVQRRGVDVGLVSHAPCALPTVKDVPVEDVVPLNDIADVLFTNTDDDGSEGAR